MEPRVIIRRKKRKKPFLKIFFVFLLLVASAVGGWYVGTNDLITIIQKKETKKKEVEEEKTSDGRQKVFTKMNYEKCRNCTIGALYYAGMESITGLNVVPNATETSVKIYANNNRLNDTFHLNLTPSLDNYTYEEINTISFDKKILQVYIGGWGQSTSNEHIFYVMEDGTVEYTPIVKDIKENWAKEDNSAKLKSYGAIEKVEDVLYITKATVSSTGNSSGGYTTIAVRSDGMYYDLSKSIANKK